MEKKPYFAPEIRVRVVMTEGRFLDTGSVEYNGSETVTTPLSKPYDPDENPFKFKSVWE